MSGNPLRPLSKVEMKDLRDSITAHGVEYPIVVRPDGSVIDGHHRKQIAEELGMSVKTQIAQVTDEQADALALELNVARRHLTRKDRAEVARSSSASTRELAETLGVSKDTVHRDRRGPVSNETGPLGRDGGRYPPSQPTNTELARIADYVREQRAKGYKQITIAAALGLDQTAVGKHIRRMGGEAAGVRVAKVVKDPPEPLAPFNWHDKPTQRGKRHHHQAATVDDIPTYKQSETRSVLNSLLGQLHNSENRLANDIDDAIDANDDEWIAAVTKELDDLTQALNRLVAVLHNPQTRQLAISDPTRRDDMAPLRLVRGGQ